MSRVIRKAVLHMRKLRRRSVYQRVCFRYIDSTISTSYLQNIKPLAIFSGPSVRFVSDLIGNSEHMYCRDAAHIGISLINNTSPSQRDKPELKHDKKR